MAKFNGEVLTRWLSKREMELLAHFSFTDDNGVLWSAPKGVTIDGSSIPRIFWVLIGSPFVGNHRRASIIHDVYCVTRSRPHKQVHKMYYDACRADGVNVVKAKLMYWALKVGAPRWKTQ